MRTALIISTFTLFLELQTRAAIVSISRRSFIHGEGIGVANQSQQTTDLTAEFDQTLSSTGGPGYIEQYTVSQRATIGVSGFSLQTSSAGSVTSGNFANVSTQTVFDLGFYVTEPSTLSLVVDYPHQLGGPDGGGVGFYFRRVSRTGTTINGTLETYFSYSGIQIPGSFTLSIPLSADPTIGYFIHLADSDNRGPANLPNSFSFTGQFSATVTPVPEPSSQLLLVFGAMLFALRRSLRTHERNG